MEIILKANVPHLGKMLDVVKVKDGYARNFLFPRKLAVRATKEAKSKTTALLLKPSSRRNSLLPVMWLPSFLRFL